MKAEVFIPSHSARSTPSTKVSIQHGRLLTLGFGRSMAMPLYAPMNEVRANLPGNWTRCHEELAKPFSTWLNGVPINHGQPGKLDY